MYNDGRTLEMTKKNLEETKQDSLLIQYIKNEIFQKNSSFIAGVFGLPGCQPTGNKVLMSNGEWKKIENIKTGDRVLSPQKDGSYNFSNVISTTKWKCNNIYKVNKKNHDKKTLYTCANNHIIPFKNREKDYEEVEAQHFKYNNTNDRAHISTTSLIPAFENRKNCEIEPYSLGVWLGDGNFNYHQKKIKTFPKKFCLVKAHTFTKKNGKIVNVKEHYKKNERGLKKWRWSTGHLIISNSNKEIMAKVNEQYPIQNSYEKKTCNGWSHSFSLNSTFAKQLTKCGLVNKNSATKYIPKTALFSDSSYRKKVLAGLIDTDGYYNKEGNGYEYLTKSKKLAEDFVFLVHSLGGMVNYCKKVKKSCQNNFVGKYYRISFNFDCELPLQNKKKIRQKNSQYKPRRHYVKVKKTNKKKWVYGFTLDSSSHWYVTNNYCITRQTGKSWCSLKIGELIDPNFTIKNVVWSIEEFLQFVVKLQERKLAGENVRGTCIVYEESGITLDSYQWQDKFRSSISHTVETMRWLGTCLIFNVPSKERMDKKIRGLMHGFFELVEKHKDYRIAKFHLIQYDLKNQIELYPFVKVQNKGWVTKIKCIKIYPPSKELTSAYEKKMVEFKSDISKSGLAKVTGYRQAVQQNMPAITNSDGGGLIDGFSVEQLESYGRKPIKPLSNRQQQCYDLKITGITHYEIAEKLGIDVATVSANLCNATKRGWNWKDAVKKENSVEEKNITTEE